MVQDVSITGPIRVALVTGGLKLGGATTFLCNLAGELLRRRIAAKVLSFELEHPLAADFAQLNIPVFLQDDLHCIFEDRATAILEELRRFQPTVTVANLGAAAFEVLRYVPRGVIRVGVAHADNPLVYAMLRNYVNHLDALAVVSKTVKATLENNPAFARVPIHYLPLGVPMVDDAQLPARDFSAPLRILYLGRLDREQKRVHLFPEILDSLKRAGMPFHWTIAGDGPERVGLEHAMKTSPTQTVSFPGKVAYAEVPGILAKHDIFLLASDYEGLPLSVVEAMGGGLVPVVSDLPSGIRELVDETIGRRVAPENIGGYAEALVALHRDRSQLMNLSRNARARVKEHFSVKAMANRWLGIFQGGTSVISWPENWSIKPPLGASGKVRFSPAARILRRLLFKLRK